MPVVKEVRSLKRIIRTVVDMKVIVSFTFMSGEKFTVPFITFTTQRNFLTFKTKKSNINLKFSRDDVKSQKDSITS